MNEALLLALKDWRSLNAVLTSLPEDQVKELLEHEEEHGRRIDFLRRIHQRYSALRLQRERIEVLKKGLV